MKLFKASYLSVIAFIALSLLIVYPAVSQEAAEDEPPEQNDSRDFFLVQILETAFSGDVSWRPDWPADIPPDAFLIRQGDRLPAVIELSNETENFVVRRNDEGQLLEFPFFYEGGYAKVQTVYTASGALRNMSVTLKNLSQQDEDEESQGEEETLDIAFPPDFLPYSDLSPGGSFPPLTVNSGDSVFFVYIFESPLFLTETWYTEDGDMSVYCKASVNVENGKWRIRSLQVHDAGGTRFTDYFFDSYGNVTEVSFQDRVFSAFFTDSGPNFWQQDGSQYDLQWDTQGILTIIKATADDGLFTEYRYGYEEDTSGNWVKRQETAYTIQFDDLLAPQPSSSRGIWNRRIVY